MPKETYAKLTAAMRSIAERHMRGFITTEEAFHLMLRLIPAKEEPRS